MTGWWRPMPMPKNTNAVTIASRASRFTPRRISPSSSVSLLLRPLPAASAAMQPIMVASPVRVTTPRPSPFITSEEENTRLRASSGAAFCAVTHAVMASDSPVRLEHSVFRSTQCMMRRSAGTRSPSDSRTMSPGTSTAASTRCVRPRACCVSGGARGARQAGASAEDKKPHRLDAVADDDA